MRVLDRIDALGRADGEEETELAGLRRKLTGRFMVLCTALVALYNPVYLALGLLDFWLTSCAILIGCGSALVLYARGAHLAGKVLLFVSGILGVVCLGVLFGSESQLPISTLFIALLCPLLFAPRERRAMAACFALAVACWVAFQATATTHTWPSRLPDAARVVIETTCLVAMAFIGILTISRLASVNEALNETLVIRSLRLSRQQGELHAAHEETQALLAALPDACFRLAWEPGTRRVEVLDLRGRVHDLWRARLVGGDCARYLPRRSLEAALAALAGAREGGGPRNFDVQWRSHGRAFQAEGRVAHAGGREYIVVLRDVTAARKAELSQLALARIRHEGARAARCAPHPGPLMPHSVLSWSEYRSSRSTSSGKRTIVQRRDDAGGEAA